MTYSSRLRKRWVVVRLLPNMQRVDVAWCFTFSDAEGYAKLLQRLDPTVRCVVMFDAGSPQKAEQVKRSPTRSRV
ncbi:hypothetical protein ACQ4M4_08600 [Leptolyngbya sp. AN02str]|uniref:hypothetical protein n=1 Tax=Leptolyngbya sp. AN02str TaxID=3423363 RepID=UPI003D31BA24